MLKYKQVIKGTSSCLRTRKYWATDLLHLAIFMYAAGVESTPRLLQRFIGLLYQHWTIDRDVCGPIRGMNRWQGKENYWQKTCPIAALSTTDTTRIHTGSKFWLTTWDTEWLLQMLQDVIWFIEDEIEDLRISVLNEMHIINIHINIISALVCLCASVSSYMFTNQLIGFIGLLYLPQLLNIFLNGNTKQNR
jgi:hypothetical protein